MTNPAVSRETRELAEQIFRGSVDQAERFAVILATTGVERGLIGPREGERLWSRHLFNCAVLAPALPPASRVVDVGSGAGLPGVVLAIVRADISMLLVEPLQRRVDFLHEVVSQLELEHVEVRRARAEDLRREVTADVVTARAVAPLPKLAALSLPLLRPHGSLLAIKGATAAAELEAAENTLRDHGAARWAVETWGGTMLAEPTTVVHVTAGAQPDRTERPASRSPSHRSQRQRRRTGPPETK